MGLNFIVGKPCIHWWGAKGNHPYSSLLMLY